MPVDAQVDRSTNSATTSSPTAQHAEEESFLFPFLINGRSGRNGGNIKRTLRNLGGALFKRDARGSGRGWFNPEDFMQQKREWAKQFKSDQGKAVGWPSHAFENFLVVGLPPTTDVKSVVADVYTAQTAKAGGANMEVTPESTKETQHRGSRGQPLPPQILYSYPPEKPVSSEVAGFCFPHGVQPVLLERTPSMSALNEVIYSQSYQNSDGASFIFVLKVADNLPLYGVCCYMEEIVHRPPSILKEQFPDSNAPLSRYLVSAPRCYCFLTHYPFFSLHLKVLHMIMGLERLDRITAFVEDVAGLPPNDTLSTRLDSAGGQAVSSDSIRTATREALANDAGAQGLLNVHHEYDQEWGTMGQPNSGQPGSPLPLAAGSTGSDAAGAPASSSASTGSQGQPGTAAPASSLDPVLEAPGAEPANPDDPVLGLPLDQLRLGEGADASHGTSALGRPPLPPAQPGGQPAAQTPTRPVHQPAGGAQDTRTPSPEAPPMQAGSSGRASEPTPHTPDQQRMQQPGASASGGAGTAAAAAAASSSHNALPSAASSPEHSQPTSSSVLVRTPSGQALTLTTPYATPFATPIGRLSSPGPSPGPSTAGRPPRPPLDPSREDPTSTRPGSFTTAEPPFPATISGSNVGAGGPGAATSNSCSSNGSAALEPGSHSGPEGTLQRSSMLTAASGHEDERSAAFTPPQLPRRDSGSRQASVLRRASERLKLAMAAQEELLQAEPRAANGEGAVDGSMLGGHRRTRSGQLRDAELAGVEPSGNSASTTNSFHTAASSQAREGALGGAGDAFSPYSGTPSSHVRNISGESLSGFSECNTPARGLPNGLPMALDRDSGSDTPSRLAHASGPEPASTAAPAERPPAVSERGETVFPEAGPSNRPGTFQRPSVKSNVRSMSFRTVMRSASENDARHMGSSTPANALQVMQSYFETEVPQPGEEYEFCPDPGLQPVHYYRPKVLESLSSEYVHRTAVAAAEAEAAEGLRHWTVAALCRSLSLENILMLITGALLERQMVFFCPNIGVLSTTVLSLVPLLRPFAWQSLLLPVLPASMLAFLEAPVPFILGVQYKTGEVASRCGSLIRVNIYKDKIKNAASLPALPNHHALLASLAPSYWQLNSVGRDKARTRPIYAISEAQRQAAEVFLKAMEAYLSGLCSNLKLHTITDVQTTDRVSLLLKDSFIDSFSAKDRPFIRQFAETQMFSVYSDSVIT